MKGFPNQVADLGKIGTALDVLAMLLEGGENPRDDGVFGPALVRAGVAGTGHVPQPADDYLQEQLQKEPSNQSFRTTARGLRELFRLLGFIEDSGGELRLTALGEEAISVARRPLGRPEIEFWRLAVRDIFHLDAQGNASHPYQVLLRLVARKPGITRAKCALALEARDDSPNELDRIVALADLPEDEIRAHIGVSQSNWDNAKKVLPKFAEQLGDVVRTGQTYVLAVAPGMGANPPAERRPRVAEPRKVGARHQRAPRAAREVTPETIARTSPIEEFDEHEPAPRDPAAEREAVLRRRDRFVRHQLLVQALSRRLDAAGAVIYADPFDLLALLDNIGVLAEIKTLDGSAEDERERVREALAQLLYYEAFATVEDAGETPLHKVACFEHEITVDHQNWLSRAGIGTIWDSGDDNQFQGNELAARMLAGLLRELG